MDVPTPYETDEYNRDLSHPRSSNGDAGAAIREAVGREVGLAIDCHWNYNVQAAIELARALEDSNCSGWRTRFRRRTSERSARCSGTPGRRSPPGESLLPARLPAPYREAGLRVLAPDVQKIGLGKAEAGGPGRDALRQPDLAQHQLARRHDGRSAPVRRGTELLALEWHAASVPFFDEIIRGAEGPMIRNGHIAVPDVPGLGIELDEDVLHVPQAGEEFFE